MNLVKKLLLPLGLLSCLAAPAFAASSPTLNSPDLLESPLIGMQGTVPDFAKIDVESPHVYDYTFTSAPTDWRVQSGIWEMTNRWACSPGWNWFGGRSNEVASIWNKRKFTGDMSVQFYFGFKMGVSGIGTDTPGWWNHTRVWEYASDAAVTIGGDGENLASGYSLIIGADENQHTILKRKTEVVAESIKPEALLPTFTDGGPDDHQGRGPGEFEVVHRRWWYVRIDKIGSRVSCYLDNKLLFSYDDPKPLDAGQMAIWTYNNGIMLSRVQIYYNQEVRPLYAKREVPPVVHPTVHLKYAQAPR